MEVKTRQQGNWDANGLLAVNAQKQTRLWQTAQQFLVTHPQYAEVSCRFDVACVLCRQVSATAGADPSSSNIIQLNQPSIWQDYCLTLVTYVEDAFQLA